MYRTAGTYNVKTAAVDLSTGNLYGWSNEETVYVADGNYEEKLIKNLQFLRYACAEILQRHLRFVDGYIQLETERLSHFALLWR